MSLTPPNIEILTCPNCGETVRSGKTVGLSDSKAVTCKKCQLKSSLGEWRMFAPDEVADVEVSHLRPLLTQQQKLVILFVLVCFGLLTLKINSKIEEPTITSEAPTEILEFAGRKWRLVGTPARHGDLSPANMIAREFRGEHPGIRVIEFLPHPNLPYCGIKRWVQQQAVPWWNCDEYKWVSHGRGERWTDDEHMVDYSLNGELDGTVKHWFANGQLKLHENYVKGKLHGRQEMYTANGIIVFRAEYVHGEEVSVVEYDRNGKPK